VPVIVPISDAAAPEIQFYRDLPSESRRAAEMRGELSYFIAEGQLVTEKLIASDVQLHSLLMTEERFALMADQLRSVSAPVYIVDTPTMHAIAGFEFHRGVLACGIRPASDDALALTLRARIIIALEHVSNPDNVGGILRSVAALAGSKASVLLGPGCADPLYRKCIRVSMGHVFRVPWACVSDLEATISGLAVSGAEVLATTPAPHASNLRQLSLRKNAQAVVLMGAEGPGLSPNIMRTSTRQVRIVMSEGVDSLNVGVATALVLDRVVQALES